jgi:hypothetical protein
MVFPVFYEASGTSARDHPSVSDHVEACRKFEVAHPSAVSEETPAGLDAPCPIGALDLPSPAPRADKEGCSFSATGPLPSVVRRSSRFA